jgi:50S ribosomal subunit-associated GTPase HflX
MTDCFQAVGAVTIYDLTRRDMLADLTCDWIPSFCDLIWRKAKIVMVGNKADLVEAGGEVELRAQEYARNEGYSHYIVSAKTGEGIKAAFEEFLALIVRSGLVPHVSAETPPESAPAIEPEADNGHLSRRSRRKASWEYIYP